TASCRRIKAEVSLRTPKGRSEQAHGLLPPWLPRLGFYAILRHTLGTQIPSIHSAQRLRQYQLQTGGVFLEQKGEECVFPSRSFHSAEYLQQHQLRMGKVLYTGMQTSRLRCERSEREETARNRLSFPNLLY
ncbi:MAG: hypothetical protein ACUVQH_14050, partial [Thermogutta sp.]